MRKLKIVLLGGILFILSYPCPAMAGLPEAVNYLKSQTQDAWITQARVAAGESGVPASHLTSVAEGGFNPTNDYAKTILALAAAGENPSTFGNIDYVAKLKTYYDGTQMGDATLLNDDIWSILALSSIYETGCPEAIAAKNFLLANQNADGGWGYSVGGSSGSNDTAAAIMALMEMGVSAGDSVIASAAAFLKTLQNNDGGFLNDPAWGTDSDSGSDGWVISAIYKMGQDPVAAAWLKNGSSSVEHLNTLQDADGGFWWVDPALSSAFNNKAMTPYAVIALSQKSFPVGYYHIPPATRLLTDKTTYNSGESVNITVEYAQYVAGDSWLPLLEAVINGADSSYKTDSSGKVSITLPSTGYSLYAQKIGYVNSDAVEITVLSAPSVIIPPAVSNPGGSSGSNGSATSPNLLDETEKLETEELEINETEETESAQSPADIEAGEEAEDEKDEEVLGVKIEEEPADKIAAEAGSIMQGGAENFTREGTESTQKLGAGERAGVLNSYKEAFGKMPETQEEWEDALRIAGGEMPNMKNEAAEERAKLEFKKIYNREYNKDDADDQKIINMMAYGLRPAARDLNLERAGIKKFAEIYKYLPGSSADWDIVRAISYNN